MCKAAQVYACSDAWAAARMLWDLLAQQALESGASTASFPASAYEFDNADIPSLPPSAGCPHALEAVLRGLLQARPMERLPQEEAISALHVFLYGPQSFEDVESIGASEADAVRGHDGDKVTAKSWIHDQRVIAVKAETAIPPLPAAALVGDMAASDQSREKDATNTRREPVGDTLVASSGAGGTASNHPESPTGPEEEDEEEEDGEDLQDTDDLSEDDEEEDEDEDDSHVFATSTSSGWAEVKQTLFESKGKAKAKAASCHVEASASAAHSATRLGLGLTDRDALMNDAIMMASRQLDSINVAPAGVNSEIAGAIPGFSMGTAGPHRFCGRFSKAVGAGILEGIQAAEAAVIEEGAIAVISPPSAGTRSLYGWGIPEVMGLARPLVDGEASMWDRHLRRIYLGSKHGATELRRGCQALVRIQRIYG